MTKTRPLSHWLLIISLYTTQLLGTGFLMVAMTAILRERGTSLADLGWLYLLGLPWGLKFLWAPLIDRFVVPRLGHYRGWLLILQASMIITLLIIAPLSLNRDLTLIAALGTAFITLSATQDIATDALATTLFHHDERGLVNGMQMAGGQLGTLIGGGGVLMLYPLIGWQGSLYLLAALTAICWLQLLFFHEPAHCTIDNPQTIRYVFTRLFNFWRGRSLWLILSIVYPFGLCITYAILTPMLIDGGWTLPEIGFATNILGGVIGIATGLLGGWLIRHWGRKRCLIVFALLQIVGLTAMLPAAMTPSTANVYLALIAYYSFYPLISTVIYTLMMDKAAKGTTPGTDYTVQISTNFISVTIGAGMALPLAEVTGYHGVIFTAIIVAAVAATISYRYSHDKQHEG